MPSNEIDSHGLFSSAQVSDKTTSRYCFTSPAVDKHGPSIKQEGMVEPFTESLFFSTRVVEEPAYNTGNDGHLPGPIFTIRPPAPSPPVRQNSLMTAFASQIQSIEIYRNVSHKIIQLVAKDLACTIKNNKLPDRDSELTTSVAQLIRDLVVKDVTPAKFDFITPPTNANKKTRAVPKLTSEFYASILPLDLAKIASEQIGKGKIARHRCIARTKKSKMKERCKKTTSYNKIAFDRLVGELSSMGKPRGFAIVARILLDLVKLVYCSANHFADAERELHETCKYFLQDVTSSNREEELRVFELWLTQLEQASNMGVVSATLFESDHNSLSEHVSSTIDAETIMTARPEHPPYSNDNMFVFERPCDLFALGFRNTSQRIITNENHAFEPYYKGDDLTKSQIESKLWRKAREKIESLGSPPPEGCSPPEGRIYVFRPTKGIGYHKIGRSSDVESRLEQWAKSCKYVVDQRADLLDDIERNAPHPERLEKLIFTELSNERRKVVGCECKVIHEEWFEIDADHAQEIVIKWTRWMQDMPYDAEGNLKEGTKLPPLGVEGYGRLAKGEIRQSKAAKVQANARRTSRRRIACPTVPQIPAASAHRMVLRSQTKSQRQTSEA